MSSSQQEFKLETQVIGFIPSFIWFRFLYLYILIVFLEICRNNEILFLNFLPAVIDNQSLVKGKAFMLKWTYLCLETCVIWQTYTIYVFRNTFSLRNMLFFFSFLNRVTHSSYSSWNPSNILLYNLQRYIYCTCDKENCSTLQNA